MGHKLTIEDDDNDVENDDKTDYGRLDGHWGMIEYPWEAFPTPALFELFWSDANWWQREGCGASVLTEHTRRASVLLPN